MEKVNNKKCSFQDHKEVDAVVYCQECKVYLCNKCENFHSKLFINHHQYKIDIDIQEIFTGYCKEENHTNKLEFFCRNHNQLCCSSCLCKIKDKKYGQHTNCEVCYLKDIKNEKRNNLKKNINNLEELSKNIDEPINKIKVLYETINNQKEELKLKIQKIFTNIRNAINEREDKLLLEIDKQFDNIYFKEEMIKTIEKLPNKIKKSLDRGNKLDKEWDDENKLILIINDCINIENNIKDINIIFDNIKKCSDIKSKIIFYPKEENEIISFIKNIKNFGSIKEYFGSNNLIDISKIIGGNYQYSQSIKNWINSNENENLKFELLYRLSENGEKFSKFHELCDNKGPTLSLFHINDDNKIGIYTPLSWDSYSDWKNDIETFIFSLNKNKKYKKLKEDMSILCKKNGGIYVYGLGIQETNCNSMKELVYYPNTRQKIFDNSSEILPNDMKEKSLSFTLKEVEVFKTLIENKF